MNAPIQIEGGEVSACSLIVSSVLSGSNEMMRTVRSSHLQPIRGMSAYVTTKTQHSQDMVSADAPQEAELGCRYNDGLARGHPPSVYPAVYQNMSNALWVNL